MFGFSISSAEPDSIAHIIQVALAPAFLLSALATLLNVFSTRLARISDKVNAATKEVQGADAVSARRLSVRLAFLRRRSVLLDVAVILACLSAALTLVSILTLFVGALRDAATASVLFACFGASLILTMGAICAFLTEILLAGRGVRVEVDQHRSEAALAPPSASSRKP
jgi:hypothetical protein